MSQTNLVPPGRSAVVRQRSADTALQPTKKRMSLSFSGLKEAVAHTVSAPNGTTGQPGAVDDLHVHSTTPTGNGGVSYEEAQLAELERELSNPYGTLSRSALRKLRSDSIVVPCSKVHEYANINCNHL